MVNKQRKSAGQTAKKRKGFTLVELVIVIAVIAVLAAVLIPTFANVIDNANRTKDQANAKIMTTEIVTKATMDGILGYSAQGVRALALQSKATQQTKSKDTSFWYNQDSRSVELHTTADLLVDPAESASLDRVVAYADGNNTYERSIYSFAIDPKYVYISGDENLDKIADILANLTTYAKLNVTAATPTAADIGAEMDKLFDGLSSQVNALADENSAIATHLNGVLGNFDPEITLYFDNLGIYGTNSGVNNATYSNYVITNGTTKVAGWTGATEAKIADSLVITFPNYCTINPNSFNNVTSASGTVAINVNIPAQNSASSAMLTQAINDMVAYQSDNNVDSEKVVQLISESHEYLDSDNPISADDLSNIGNLVAKVDTSVKQQVSTTTSNSNVNVSQNVQNKVQYATLRFDYGYIQSELRVSSGRNTLYYRTENAITGGTEAISGVLKHEGLAAASVSLKSDADKTSASLISAYSVSDVTDPVASSEYLIPTLSLNLGKELAALGITDQLGKDDSVRIYYKNYADYGEVSGVCVFYTDNGVVSYTLAPAMYIKRVVMNYVELDSILGLQGGYAFSFPDTSKSVNLNNMSVHAIVNGNDYTMSKINSAGSFHDGKYIIKDASGSILQNYYQGLTEIYVKDNSGNVVFRQFIEKRVETPAEPVAPEVE